METRHRQTEAWGKLFSELCRADRAVLRKIMQLMLKFPVRKWKFVQACCLPLVLG